MGCQVSSIWKDNFAYDRERVDVSWELKPMETAVPCQGELCPRGSSDVLCRVWPGQSLRAVGRAVSVPVLSMLCPSRMLSWSRDGAEAELDRWAQTFCGISCSSAPCNQVEPPSRHPWIQSQALLLCDLITDSNSCCLQLNCPVSHCTRPSDLSGDGSLTSGLCFLGCWIVFVPRWCCGCAGGDCNYALSIFILLNHFCTTWSDVFFTF